MVSTEDKDIAAIARESGAYVLNRPPELAADDTETIDVVRHALTVFNGDDLVLLLQPTSPLRTGRDIDAALESLVAGDMLVSMCAGERNGAIYIAPASHLKTADFEARQTYEMPAERSVDIDTEEDFNRAAGMLDLELAYWAMP